MNPKEIRNKVFPKEYQGKTITPNSLFEQFIEIRRGKIPAGFIVKVQNHGLTRHSDFMNGALKLRATIRDLEGSQNNEDFFLSALYALDEHVNLLKRYLAMHGEIVPDNPEELVVMRMMED